MKAKLIGVVLVVAIATGIIVLKVRSAEKTVTSSSTANSATPQVLLFAKPGEAASVARCGQIVREVRAAAERGVSVREIAPSSNAELMRQYHVLTTPTVVLLASNGSVRARYEGEAQETLDAVRSEMQRLHP
jgi:hypothetical protein